MPQHISVVILQLLLAAEHEQRARVVQRPRGVDPCQSARAHVHGHFPFAGKRFRNRFHRQVATEKPGATGILAEDQAAHVGVQAVCADDDVEGAWRIVLESDLTVERDRRDRISEQVLDVAAAGAVIRLAEVVAHDLDVPVGRRAEDLREIDARRPLDALAIHGHRGRPGGQRLDLRQHAHLCRDFHGGPEQVDGMAAGLAQFGCALDDRDVEGAAGKPVRQYGARDARPEIRIRMSTPSRLGDPNIALTYR